MLKIRLQRVGRKNDASFRVVVIESQRGPKAGNALEVLGFYDPKKNITEIKGDRVTHWISVGAQPSNTVHNILVKEKIIKGEKRNVLPKKSPIKKEGESEEKTKTKEDSAGTDDKKEEKKSEPETSDTAKEEPKTEEKPNDSADKKEEEKA